MVSGTRCSYVSVCRCEVVRGAAAPKGSMTYAFTHIRNFLLPQKLAKIGRIWQILAGFGRIWQDLGFRAGIWASRLGFGPRGWILGLKAGIWTSRLGFRPKDWDLGLKARILALRRRRGRRNLCICKSIGQRPQRGRCPKSEDERNKAGYTTPLVACGWSLDCLGNSSEVKE